MDFRQVKAIEKANKEKLLKLFPFLTEDSGIYILTREENGFKFAYVGQAKHILTRLAQHLSGYQYIDNSLKAHKFKSADNPCGYELKVYNVVGSLDGWEQYYIRKYANDGYQMRNKTAGGKGKGKFEIAETKPKKTYRDGLKQGYENARRDIARLFRASLICEVNGKTNKTKEKAMAKFKAFIEGEEDG
jgi:hypothetical protein